MQAFVSDIRLCEIPDIQVGLLMLGTFVSISGINEGQIVSLLYSGQSLIQIYFPHHWLWITISSLPEDGMQLAR